MKNYLIVDKKAFTFEEKTYYSIIVLQKSKDSIGYSVKYRYKRDGSKSVYFPCSKDFFENLSTVPAEFSNLQVDIGGHVIGAVR